MPIPQDDLERASQLVGRLQQRTGGSGKYQEELRRLQDTLKSRVFQELTDPTECARRSVTPDVEVAAICGISTGSGSSTQGEATAASFTDDTSQRQKLAHESALAYLNEKPAFRDVLLAEARGADIYHVKINRPGQKSLGFSIVGLRSDTLVQMGIFIKDIVPHGPAALEGSLCVGDQILAIGDKILEQTTEAQQEAVGLLQRSSGVVELWMCRRKGALPFIPTPSTPSSPAPAEVIQSNSGQEWRQVENIIIRKQSADQGLGIGVSSSTDDKSVVISQLVVGGLASQDGRLHVNDQLLAINGQLTAGKTLNEVVEQLRQPALLVKLQTARIVSGEAPHVTKRKVSTQVGGEVVSVSLKKSKEKGLGLTIAAYITNEDENRYGIIVKEVMPDSFAAQNDLVLQHDQVIEVDGQSLRGKSNSEAVKILKGTGNVVNLKLLRHKSPPNVAEPSSSASTSEPTGESDPALKWKNQVLDEEEVVVVQLTKGEGGALGMVVEAGEGDFWPKGQTAHIVCEICEGGPVDKNGEIQLNDRLLQAGDTELTACDHEGAVNAIRKCDQKFSLVLARWKPGKAWPPKDSTGEKTEPGQVLTQSPSQPEIRQRTPHVPPVTKWSEKVIDVDLMKPDSGGLGFSVLDYQHPDNPQETVILVRTVVPGTPAGQSGKIFENQRLMHINNIPMVGITLDKAVPILKSQPVGPVVVGVSQPDAQTPPASQHPDHAHVPDEDAPPPYHSLESEAVITVIKPGNLPLGLDIDIEEGKRGVVVTNILRNGAVGKDGRVQVGDQIVAVNDQPMGGSSPSQARALLRTATTVKDSFELTYVPVNPRKGNTLPYRASPERSNTGQGSPWQTRWTAYSAPHEVIVPRMESGGLGISIVGGNTEVESDSGGKYSIPGIFIKHVLPDSPAGRSGQLQSGDRVLQVNSTDLRDANHSEAVDAIRAAGSPVTFLIQSLPAGMRESRKARKRREAAEAAIARSRDASPRLGEEIIALRKKYSDINGDINLVHLVKGDEGLGIGITGGKESADEVSVALVRLGGPADGKIKMKDVLLEVNGVSLKGLTHNEASDLLRNSPRQVTLLVARNVIPPPEPEPETEKVPYANETGLQNEGPATPSGCDETRTVVVEKIPGHGLGLALARDRSNPDSGIFVKSIGLGSPADKTGSIFEGNELISVNGLLVKDLEYSAVIQTLKTAVGTVTLVLKEGVRGKGGVRKKSIDSPTKAASTETATSAAPAHQDDPADAIIVDLFKPQDASLGISIVERAMPSLTDEQSCAIFIADVVPGGLVQKDGRIKPGDRLLRVNSKPLHNAGQAEAVSTLKALQGRITLIVQRDLKESSMSSTTPATTPATTHETAANMPADVPKTPQRDSAGVPVEVIINKQPGQPLGMSIAGGKTNPSGDTAIIIASLQQNGLASQTQKLQVGDRLVKVNDESVVGKTRDDVVALLRSSEGTLKLVVVHHPASTPSTPDTSTPSALGKQQQSRHKEIELEKGADGLGFSIVGGRNSSGSNFPIYVKDVLAKGAAAQNGQLKCGDQIVAVNGRNLEGMDHDEVLALLRENSVVHLTVLS